VFNVFVFKILFFSLKNCSFSFLVSFLVSFVVFFSFAFQVILYNVKSFAVYSELTKTYSEMFGVHPTLDEVINVGMFKKRTLNKLLMKYHPDHYGNDNVFKEINTSFT